MAVAKVVELDLSPSELLPYVVDLEHLRSWAAEWHDPEIEGGREIPWDEKLQGRLVEIRDLHGPVLAGGGAFEIDGAVVNGKQGRAAVCEDGRYLVETVDGDTLYIPKENLITCLSMPEDMKTGESTDVLSWEDGTFPFGLMATAVETIQQRGYCLIKTPDAHRHEEALALSAKNLRNSAQPKSDFASALGLGFGEEFTWLGAADDHERCGPLIDFCASIAPFAPQEFGFVASPTPAFTLLRKLRPGAVKHPAVEIADDTHTFMDFAQRRRLCIIYLPYGNCEVELSSRQSSTLTVKLSLVAQSLFVFRHDLFNYTIHAGKAPAMALQTWLVREFNKLQVREVFGSTDEVMDIIGASGQLIRRSDDVHVMGAASLASGGTFSQLPPFFNGNTDGYVLVPYLRWDHDLYYAPNYEDGLSVSKHAGFCDSEYCFQMDHDFFGIKYEEAESLSFTGYKIIELAFEALSVAGFTKDSLRGAPINHYGADASRDVESPMRLSNPSVMASRWSEHYTYPTLINHLFGMTGTSLLIDTACSASNVAMNCLYQELMESRNARQYGLAERDSRRHTSLLTSTAPLNNPVGFVGLSQGRMLGKMGRCQTFNASASGFARGEAFGAIVVTKRSDVEASIQQLMGIGGGHTNQDGRSASLTAPNGPSQSAVIRGSFRCAGITFQDVSSTELHGTGTALGDPIETGSMRAVMMGKDGSRVVPLPHCAQKSLTGHPELVAGIIGFLHQMGCIRLATIPPNCHLRELNHNIEDAGFPGLWQTECVDVGLESFYAGVCSFGFGGSNARTEFYGRCSAGARAVSPFSMVPDGSGAVAHVQRDQGRALKFDRLSTCTIDCPTCGRSMCLLCKEAVENSFAQSHICYSVREKYFNSYDSCSSCYKGGYIRGYPDDD